MAKVQKVCRVCNKEYTYCPSCNYNEPTYKQLVCCEDCNTIWTVLSRNGVGLASAQETLDALAGIKLPSTIQSGIKAHIDRIKAEVKPVAKKVKQPVEETVEEVVHDESEEAHKTQKKDAENEQPSQE